MKFINGNCLEKLKELPDNSVDSIVTDPPYGLGKEPDPKQILEMWLNDETKNISGKGFMSKDWDAFVPQPAIWKECFRVLKPGGHMLVACGTRTHDWMTLSIRFAGFKIKDCIIWIYGSGMPKSLNIGANFNKLEPKEWSNIGNAIDKFINNKELLSLWKNNLNNVKIVEESYIKNTIGIGMNIIKKDFVQENVAVNINQRNYDLIVNFVEKNLNEAQVINTKINTVLQNVEVEIRQLQNHVKYVELLSQDQNHNVLTIFSVQNNVKEWLNENMLVKHEIDEVLKILRGKKKYSNEDIINVLNAVLTNILKHIILNQSVTFQNLDTTQKMECVSAMNVIIIKSIMDNLILNMVNIVKEIVNEKLRLNERKVIGYDKGTSLSVQNKVNAEQGHRPNDYYENKDGTFEITKGNSKWEGWGTHLKPAVELWTLAQKPISERNIAENVLKWGTGGINIDDCRVGVSRPPTCNDPNKFTEWKEQDGCERQPSCNPDEDINKGRFPANLILSHHPDCKLNGIKTVKTNTHYPDMTVTGYGKNYGGKTEYNKEGERIFEEIVENWECVDDCPLKMMDTQSGKTKSSLFKSNSTKGKRINCYNQDSFEYSGKGYTDIGGASRFFYCAKASKSERNEGLDDSFEEKNYPKEHYSSERLNDLRMKHEQNRNPNKNNHPTVKPLSLMKYLCKLITPPEGIILDPFMGTGTTGIASIYENFDFIGIELDPEYFKIAESRINHAIKKKTNGLEIQLNPEIQNKSTNNIKTLDKFGVE